MLADVGRRVERGREGGWERRAGGREGRKEVKREGNIGESNSDKEWEGQEREDHEH